jgi:hypothetical protein
MDLQLLSKIGLAILMIFASITLLLAWLWLGRESRFLLASGLEAVRQCGMAAGNACRILMAGDYPTYQGSVLPGRKFNNFDRFLVCLGFFTLIIFCAWWLWEFDRQTDRYLYPNG